MQMSMQGIHSGTAENAQHPALLSSSELKDRQPTSQHFSALHGNQDIQTDRGHGSMLHIVLSAQTTVQKKHSRLKYG